VIGGSGTAIALLGDARPVLVGSAQWTPAGKPWMRWRMRSLIGALLVLMGSVLWPASADLADMQPIIQYTLPADIMQVEFGQETWVYRLYEDGTVKKVINKRILATQDSGNGKQVSRT